MPALQGSPVDVELTSTSQVYPTPGKGPQGRLTDLVNSNVRRYGIERSATDADLARAVTKLRTDKRDGYSAFKNVFFATSPLATLPTDTTGTGLLGDANGSTLAIINSQPNVYSTARAAFGAYAYNVANQRLTNEVTYSQNSIAFAPDHSHVANRTMTAWVEKGKRTSGGAVSNNVTGVQYMVSDDNGAIITAPNLIDSTGLRIRTVSDGTYFWIVYDDGITFNAKVYDNNGTIISTNAWTPTGNPFASWDIVNFPTVGVLVAYASTAAGGITLQKLTTNGVSITRTSGGTSVSAGFNVNMLCTFLTTSSTARAYLMTAAESGATSPIQAIDITSALGSTHTYAIATYDSTTARIGAACGYTLTSATNTDITTAFTFLPVSPQLPDPVDPTYASLTTLYGNKPAFQQCDNRIAAYLTTFGGTSTQLKDIRGANVCSRAFQLDGFWYCGLYSPDPTAAQPCYFLMSFRGQSIVNTDFQRIAGQFEYGAAYAPELCYYETSTPTPTANRFHVPSTFVDALGRTRVPLSYRNENIFQTIVVGERAAAEFFNLKGSNIQVTAEQTLSTVGIKTWSLQAGFNESIRVGNQTMLPGACGSVFNDAPTELGISLAPHVLNVDTVAAGSVLGKHAWVCVWEWTDANGNFWRSPPSLAVENTDANAAATHTYTVKGRCIYLTNKRNLRAALYRDTNLGGVRSISADGTPIYYKLVSDLQPVINRDDGTATFSFDDNVAETTLAKNEILYTSDGLLPRYPSPSFHAGCVWQNRPCVIGHDNRVWIGGEFTNGDGLWWHPGLTLSVPTNDPINSIRALDSRLFIICANSVFYADAGMLPDSTGQNGTLPRVIPMPFTNGGTGATLAVRDGIIYASSAGGPWLLTRDLLNQWIGEDYQDNLSGTIRQIVSDGNQRVYFVVQGAAESSLVVFDIVSRVWGRHALPFAMPTTAVAASVGGKLTTISGTYAWQLGNGLKYDFLTDTSTKYYIAQYAKVAAVRLNGIRNYKRTWGIQVNGEVKDPCAALIRMSYPDHEAPDQDFTMTFDPIVSTKLFPVELRATVQQAAGYGFEIFESGTGTFGSGYSLTGFTFYVGIQPGTAKVAENRRF